MIPGIGNVFVPGIARSKKPIVPGINRSRSIWAMSSVETHFSAIEGLKGVTWDGRTSSAWHEQPDGSLVECKPNELRIAGARRVENLLPTADFEEGSNVKAGDAAVPVITQGAVGPAYEMQAWNLQLDISATAVGSKEYAAVYLSPLPLENVPSDGAWRSAWMRSADGNEYIVCFNISVGVSRVTIPADGVWRRYAWFQGSQFTANPHKFILGLQEGYGTTPTANIDVAGVSMCAELAEYVAPEMRAFGAAGVKYFPRENGNTVDENGVVTEAEGAKLPGPFYARLQPEHIVDGATVTEDGALTVSNISPSGNPQIKFIAENGDVKTEPVFGDELIVNGDFSDGPNGWNVGAALDVTYDPTFSAVRNANNGSITQIMDLPAGQYLTIINVITVTGAIAVYSSLGAGGSWVKMQVGVNSWVIDRQAGVGTFYIELNAEGESINLADVSYRKIHPLCEYDPDTKNLTVGHDTTTTREIILNPQNHRSF